ncbi:MAG TPA: aminotransferase class IV, partial [Chitinophagaceae bacterium]|nr:aminotransferase class IV [Chitinophagaceae bacterium]
SIDVFSNLKSANYLPYVMAAVWVKENKFDDALILNHHNRICDATIANVFWIKDAKIFTPPLSEGCVAGVMRKNILDLRLQIADLGLHLEESELAPGDLLNADEVFLTNVTTGIRWVRQCGNKVYRSTITHKLSVELFQTISS